MFGRTSGSSEPADATTTTGAEAPKARSKRRSALGFLHEVPVLIVLALLLAILLKTFVVQAFFIPSGSMQPALEPGDRVLVNKVFDDPTRGDVVVFADPHNRPRPDRGIVGGFLHWLTEAIGIARPEDEDFIKRVIGLPGESIEIRRDVVYVDGSPLTEPYLTREARDAMSDFGPIVVPEGSLFVMGDNRGNSDDSRGGLGFVPIGKVIGTAFVVVWPPSRIGWVH